VIFASLWGILLWQEILPTSSWLAIALIVLSGVISLKAGPRLPAI
jgi:drug/metabolite transporter (DMT)-like permease